MAGISLLGFKVAYYWKKVDEYSKKNFRFIMHKQWAF